MSQAASTNWKSQRYLAFAVFTFIAFSACSSCAPKSTSNSPAPTSEASRKRENVPPLRKLLQAGPKVDLLARVEVDRGAVRGKFHRQAGCVVIPAVRAAQLNVDVELPHQYILEMDVAKTSTAPGSLNLGFWASRRDRAAVILDGWDQRVSAICRIDGRIGESNESTRKIDVFTDSRTRKLRITVRLEGVQVELDGQPLVEFFGPALRLSFDDRFFTSPKPDQLMLGGWEAEFRVTRWELTPLDFESSQIAAAQSTPRVDFSALVGPKLPDRATYDAAGQDAPSRPKTDSPTPVETPTPDTADVADVPRVEQKSEERPPSADERRSREADEAAAASSEWAAKEVPWQVELDPYPGWDGTLLASTKISFTGRGCAPLNPSPFVMFYDDKDAATAELLNVKKYSVYDLRKGKQVGVTCEVKWDNHGYELDPSGRYFLTREAGGLINKIVVRSFVTGQIVLETEIPLNRRLHLHPYALASNHTFVRTIADDKRVQLRCWDLRTGEVRATYDVGENIEALESMFITPGGRYAMLHFQDGRGGVQLLDVFELSTGKHVGRLRPPAQAEIGASSAFHRTGKEFASISYSQLSKENMLWCFDWATGRTTLLAPILEAANASPGRYGAGPSLEWTADDDLLLYLGSALIDRKTGKICYLLPVSKINGAPQRVLSRKLVLSSPLGKSEEPNVYRAVELDEQAINRAVQTVQSGASYVDLGLPKLTNAKIDGARVLTAPQAAVPLSLSPPARPAFPATTWDRRVRIGQFDDPSNVVRRVEMSDPPTAAAVAHFTIKDATRRHRIETLVRVDLKRDGAVSSMTLREDFRLIGVSPDGERAIVGRIPERSMLDKTQPDSFFRLDLLDLVRKQHVVGWHPEHFGPYDLIEDPNKEEKARHPHSVSWLRILDREHVVTVNAAGSLVCWKIPEVQAAYRCDDFGTPLATSANRRYLVGTNGSKIHVLDMMEGVWAGTLEFPAAPEAITRAGFSLDQTELAVAVSYSALKTELAFFDLKTGALKSSFPVSLAAIPKDQPSQAGKEYSLHWTGPGRWLIDDMYLVDCDRKSKTWIYTAPDGRFIFNKPDDRLWWTEVKPDPKRNGSYFDVWLSASSVPSDKVMEYISSVGAGPFANPVGRSDLSSDDEKIIKFPP